jgi:hypothetical protein
MDRLMAANHDKSVEITGHFPSVVSHNLDESIRMIDHQHLSALYEAKNTVVNALDNAVLQGQLDLLKQHVDACFHFWKLIRIEMVPSRHTLEELYRMKMDEQALPLGRRSAGSHSPVKRGVARPEKKAKQAYMRALAQLWHEALVLDDVFLLCADLNELKRLMVSYSATIASFKPTQLFP